MLASRHLKTLLAVGLTIATAARADDNQEVLAKLAQGALLGCWEHERLGVTSYSEGKQIRIGCHLMCFNDRGVMAGVTFDAGDGWDWDYYYRLEDNRIVVYAWWNDQKYSWNTKFVIKQIGKSELVVESAGQTLTYKLVCRTEQKDGQCGRMKETIEEPAQIEAQ